MVRVAAMFALTVVWMVLDFCPATPAWAQSGATSPVEAIALYQGPDREQKLLEGARKEGSFNLYTSMIAPDQDVLSDAFTKKYGIKLQYWRGGSGALLPRLGWGGPPGCVRGGAREHKRRAAGRGPARR